VKNLVQILQFLRNSNENEVALEVLGHFAKNADDVQTLAGISDIYMIFHDYDNAVKYGELALEKPVEQQEIKEAIEVSLVPKYRSAYYPEKALKIINKIYDKNPTANVLLEKAGCLYENNQKEEAYELLKTLDDSTLEEYLLTKKNALIAPHLLRNHEFKDGMRGIVFETDKLRNSDHGSEVYHNKNMLPLELWYGTNDCKNLIVFAEAGLGDEIINIRFLNILKNKGFNVKWLAHWHKNADVNKRVGVAEWFKNNGFDVITEINPKDHKDYMWTYSQYLPILLDLDEKELWTGPYMKANKKKLKANKKKNIAIRWSGNPYPKHRNFPLKDLYAVLKDVNANFYSLQKDYDMEELKDFPGIIDLSEKIESFTDTVDYINSMDLTITCPTCICPAAGALDKECITIIPINDYYLFNTLNDKTPWFSDKMTIVRQKTPRVWSNIMDEVATLVKEKLSK